MKQSSLSVVVKFFGSVVFYAIIVIGETLLGSFSRALFLFVLAFLLHLITVALRLVTKAHRPHKKTTNPILKNVSQFSYPSMHVGRVSALFFSYILLFHVTFALVTAGLFLIGVVAYQRYYSKDHRLIDIAGGLLLAWIVTFLLYWIFGAYQLF